MVWTPELTGRFLDHACHDRLYALYHLITFRGLRRGEGCRAHWTDLNEKPNELAIRWQLLQLGWETELGTPKTDDSDAIVALDEGTMLVLRAHRSAQRRERDAAGEAWVDTGLVFTEHDGRPLHPANVPTDSRNWSSRPDCHQFDCTMCVTARPLSLWRRAST